MNYSEKEIMQYVEEEDVKFIRLAFCDIFGRQKNISVMPDELERVFAYGAAIDASAIKGFGGNVYSDLFLHPDISTISVLPWRPDNGKVVRMYCDILKPDGTPFECDTRYILKKAVDCAKKAGYKFFFGAEIEFYLFKIDDFGNPTDEPYDYAGYMDIAPEDKGENVRREICLTLEKMGITPESSHHEEGPGQNEIDFRFADPLAAADNAVTFCSVVKTIAARNGLYADFTPKPVSGRPGNGYHINISVQDGQKDDLLPYVISGVLDNIYDMTAFLNPCEASYRRLGEHKAPSYISWSPENRSQLIRVPAAKDIYRRIELRSPDPMANPYLAYALVIYAALQGLEKKKMPPKPYNINLFETDSEKLKELKKLPKSIFDAYQAAKASEFIKKCLPENLTESFLEG